MERKKKSIRGKWRKTRGKKERKAAGGQGGRLSFVKTLSEGEG